MLLASCCSCCSFSGTALPAHPSFFVFRRVFGWTKKNEIGNGRWVMMGLAIGLLTEYATAVDFVDQIKLMVSYLGIADLSE